MQCILWLLLPSSKGPAEKRLRLQPQLRSDCKLLSPIVCQGWPPIHGFSLHNYRLLSCNKCCIQHMHGSSTHASIMSIWLARWQQHPQIGNPHVAACCTCHASTASGQSHRQHGTGIKPAMSYGSLLSCGVLYKQHSAKQSELNCASP